MLSGAPAALKALLALADYALALSPVLPADEEALNPTNVDRLADEIGSLYNTAGDEDEDEQLMQLISSNIS